MAFLALVAVLLSVLLLLAAGAGSNGDLVVDRLRAALSALRQACGIYGLWRRNTMRKGQSRHLKKKQNP